MQNVMKEFQKRFGEGTAFDLDYGKLIILGLLIYMAFFKEYGQKTLMECGARHLVQGRNQKGEEDELCSDFDVEERANCRR